jgi:hypothetical protein
MKNFGIPLKSNENGERIKTQLFCPDHLGPITV